MKFGLKIKDGRIISEFGGIGQSIADALNRNNDVYYLKALKNDIERLDNSLHEPIMIHFSDYTYFKINSEVVTSYLYNPFDEDENPEIEMGSIKTSDFLPILSEYLELMIGEDLESIQKLDSIYGILDKFLESKDEIIHSYWKRKDFAEIWLNKGAEPWGETNIVKSYKLQFKDDKIRVTKNRQYKDQAPAIFELNNHGAEELISYLMEDAEQWYKEKMKMFYDENQQLVCVPVEV